MLKIKKIVVVLLFLSTATLSPFLYSLSTNIPKQIFQTHKSQEYIDSNPELKRAQDSWRNHSGFTYYIYNDEACDLFMEAYYPELYDMYNDLPVKVMKADLWRYCIIHQFGGIYADVDTVCLVDDLESLIVENKFSVVSENDGPFLCQWFFASPKGDGVLKSVIDTVAERCFSGVKQTPHFIHLYTGPAAFTDGIEKYMRELNKLNLDNIELVEDKRKYTSNSMIHFYTPSEFFHRSIVEHLFAGSWMDGWKSEVKY